MRLNLLIVAMLVVSPIGVAAGQEPPTASSPQNNPILLTPVKGGANLNIGLIDDVCKLNERKTLVYCLKNVAAQDVANSVNQWLQERLKTKNVKVDGFICNAPIIIVPDTGTNSLVVSMSADFQDQEQLEQVIRALDQEPRSVQIQAVLKKTVDGNTVVIGTPKIIVRENMQGRITLDVDGEQYTIELTARVIQSASTNPAIEHSAKKAEPTSDLLKSR